MLQKLALRCLEFLVLLVFMVVAFWLGYEYRNYELSVQRSNIQQTENMI